MSNASKFKFTRNPGLDRSASLGVKLSQTQWAELLEASNEKIAREKGARECTEARLQDHVAALRKERNRADDLERKCKDITEDIDEAQKEWNYLRKIVLAAFDAEQRSRICGPPSEEENIRTRELVTCLIAEHARFRAEAYEARKRKVAVVKKPVGAPKDVPETAALLAQQELEAQDRGRNAILSAKEAEISSLAEQLGKCEAQVADLSLRHQQELEDKLQSHRKACLQEMDDFYKTNYENEYNKARDNFKREVAADLQKQWQHVVETARKEGENEINVKLGIISERQQIIMIKECYIKELKAEKESLIEKHAKDIRRLLEEKQQIESKSRSEMAEATLLSEKQISDLENKCEELEAYIKQREKQHLERFEGQLAAEDAKISKLKEEHVATINRLEEARTRADLEHDQVQQRSMQELHAKDAEIATSRAEHVAAIQRLVEGYMRREAEQSQKHRQEVAQLRAQSDKKLADTMNNLAAELAARAVAYEKNIQHQATQAMEDKAAAEIKLHRIIEAQAKDIKARDVDLFRRDKFEAAPERVIRAQFETLYNLVEDLCTPRWLDTQSLWSDSVLKNVSSNPDRLREQLLRDKVWWLLYDAVFCSPFRMFGVPGRELEQEWIKAHPESTDPELYASDFAWPSPTYDAERWRWEAIKASAEALQKPTSHLDPRALLKKGFKGARDDLIKEITVAIEKVAEVDAKVRTLIDAVAKRATALWVEYQSQRCRLMVIMPTDRIESEEEKVELANAKTLQLTKVPGLLRFGDDSGHDLYSRQYVESCEPQKTKIS